MSERKNRCAKYVYSGNSMIAAPCSRVGVAEENGKWWCTQHTPSRLSAKRAERDVARKRRYERDRRMDAARLEIGSSKTQALELCRQLLNGSVADVQSMAMLIVTRYDTAEKELARLQSEDIDG